MSLTTIQSNASSFASFIEHALSSGRFMSVADELDATLSVQCVCEYIINNADTLRNTPAREHEKVFSVVSDASEMFKEMFLYGDTPRDAALARRRWGAVSALIIEPMLSHLDTLITSNTPTETIVEIVNEVRDVTIHFITTAQPSSESYEALRTRVLSSFS